MGRSANITRTTKETDIAVSLELDGTGQGTIETGIGFFDHMLEGFKKHGFFDLDCKVKGDLQVDAVGDKVGIKRYGSFMLHMDDALCLCAIDLSGRPYFSYECDIKAPMVGDFDTELVREFFYAISYAGAMNLHIKMLSGTNAHHMIEAMFKAFAKALDEAVTKDPRITSVLSTKGSL